MYLPLAEEHVLAEGIEVLRVKLSVPDHLLDIFNGSLRHSGAKKQQSCEALVITRSVCFVTYDSNQ